MERFLMSLGYQSFRENEVKFDVWLVSPVNNVFQIGTGSGESKSNACNFLQERKPRRDTRSISCENFPVQDTFILIRKFYGNFERREGTKERQKGFSKRVP